MSCNYFGILTSPEHGTHIHRNIMLCYFPERDKLQKFLNRKIWQLHEKLLWIFPNFKDVCITDVLSLSWRLKLTKYLNVTHLSYKNVYSYTEYTASGQTDRPRKQTLCLLGVRLPSLGSFNTAFRYCLSLDTLSTVAGLSRNWTSQNHRSLFHSSRLVSSSRKPSDFWGKMWGIFHKTER